MTFALRDYQARMIAETRDHMRAGRKAILCQAATGAGKTALAAFMLGTASAKNNRCGFLVHRRELVSQSAKMFERVGIPYSVMSPGFQPPRGHSFYYPDARIQIASVQTVGRRLDRIPDYDFITWDEAHHCSAGTWKKIRARFPKAYHVGLTATPWRLDGAGLGEYFEVMVQGPPIRDLIRLSHLSAYELYAPPGVSIQGLHLRAGDYAQEELRQAVDKPTVTGDIVKHYWRHARGKRALGFAVNVEHSKHVVAEFNKYGIPAAHVDAETNSDIRDAIFADLEAGTLLVVMNVDLASEGFDCPAVEAVILARPTQSLGMYLQQVGRALRPSPGKDKAIILDHAGNSLEHGLPDDERDWTLEGRGGMSRARLNGSLSLRTCMACFRVQRSGPPKCLYCGAVFEVQGRQVEFAEGELERRATTFDGPPLTVPVQPKPRKVDTMTEAELVTLFKTKGYRRPNLLARSIITQRALHASLGG